ncbi:MAG: protease modulator HflC [Candidatus Eisenbacteria sp.]|nr:protease modulator HflC [Candidatus Eisenbacteria bacterium]
MGVKWVSLIVGVGVVLLILNSAFFQVAETEMAIVTQFGKPVRVIKKAGLSIKLPMPLQAIRRFDRRLIVFDPKPAEFLTSDKKNVLVDVYLGWQIGDPLRFLKSVKDRSVAELFLADLTYAAIGAELGNYPLSALVSTVSESLHVDTIRERVTEKCRARAQQDYGIEILEVRVKRLNLPDQNKESVFDRMRTERERQAKKYRSEGEEEAMKIRAETDKETRVLLAGAYKESQRILGEADAEAARIYASAYSRNPEFYKMIRTLESYRKFMDEKTTVILSTDSELLNLMVEGNP